MLHTCFANRSARFGSLLHRATRCAANVPGVRALAFLVAAPCIATSAESPEKIAIAGLCRPVEIIPDHWGVAHIMPPTNTTSSLRRDSAPPAIACSSSRCGAGRQPARLPRSSGPTRQALHRQPAVPLPRRPYSGAQLVSPPRGGHRRCIGFCHGTALFRVDTDDTHCRKLVDTRNETPECIRRAPAPLPDILRLGMHEHDTGKFDQWEVAWNGAGLHPLLPGARSGTTLENDYSGNWIPLRESTICFSNPVRDRQPLGNP